MAKNSKGDSVRVDRSSVTSPRVTRVTPEGRLLYDPLSVVHSEPARKHLKELEENNPSKPSPTKP